MRWERGASGHATVSVTVAVCQRWRLGCEPQPPDVTMPPNAGQYHIMTIRITSAQDRHLERIAQRQGLPKAACIRLLIDADLRRGAAHNPLTA